MTSSTNQLFIFDTNTLISGALIQNSSPALALIVAIESGDLCFSKDTLLELKEVLERKKFDKYLSPNQRLEFFENLKKATRIFYPERKFELCRDPNDNKFLELAFISEAHYLITGDQDLLILNKFYQTKIISPSDFLSQKQI
ncbi:MAG: putative toxin-antitoxin system toxin component, PIN family [Algoriphagus aquaeductus]|uniref:putative toxin-antitoxin system toxin component, PIN family n=1 Tax=Algoriphagus TaxID=246875 RepID=UPI00164F6F1B|nr:putative toxin-antitoxin system toxin component, PIN family [Algoriphagus sp. AK58]MBC6366673.1 putative toxin-antitoxin system toxin component, PIN family [Algoriphagus sp. AK58]